MYSLNISGSDLYFKDISLNELPQVLDWYNNRDYKYAIGMDNPVTLDILTQSYSRLICSSNEFFVGIYEAQNRMIGVLKGQLHSDGRNALWIRSIVIDLPYQNMGYGSAAINLLFAHLKGNKGVEIAYLSVVEENQKGISFWRKHNFIVVKRIESHITLCGQKCNAVIMSREL